MFKRGRCMTSTGTNRARTRKILFGSLLLVVLSLAPASRSRASSGGNGGTIPFLVQSKVALTPNVVAAIGSHVVQVTYIWPGINAMAVKVKPSKFFELSSDPLVALVEADQQSQAPGENSYGATGVAGARPGSAL